ncbi:MAG: hypothetical protein WBM87_03385 [Woeseiaceae bacterium]
MDIDTCGHKVFGTGLMLAMLLAAVAGHAQDNAPVDDELLPAVETSADVVATPPEVTRNTAGSRVMDSMELGRTEITGNQELPKVLYIVPWKKSDPGDFLGRPINTLLDEVLEPIDREEFIRQVRYYEDLNGEKQE